MTINKLIKKLNNKKRLKKKFNSSLFRLVCQIYDLIIITAKPTKNK